MGDGFGGGVALGGLEDWKGAGEDGVEEVVEEGLLLESRWFIAGGCSCKAGKGTCEETTKRKFPSLCAGHRGRLFPGLTVALLFPGSTWSSAQPLVHRENMSHIQGLQSESSRSHFGSNLPLLQLPGAQDSSSHLVPF